MPARHASRRVKDAGDLPLVLNLHDFEGLLGVGQRTVERLYRARQLPRPLIDNGRPRFARAVVLAWLDGASTRRGRR